MNCVSFNELCKLAKLIHADIMAKQVGNPSGGQVDPSFEKTRLTKAAEEWEVLSKKLPADSWVGKNAADEARRCREAADRIGEPAISMDWVGW